MVNGSIVEISWPEDRRGWRLEVQTNSLDVGLFTNWFPWRFPWPDSAATTSVTLPILPGNPAVFFRLVYP